MFTNGTKFNDGHDDWIIADMEMVGDYTIYHCCNVLIPSISAPFDEDTIVNYIRYATV